jgi:cell division protein FtsZ
MNPTPETVVPSIPPQRAPTFKVIGVGGAGAAAVQLMAANGLADLSFAVAHTDARLISQSPIRDKVLLGAGLTRGLGAGGEPAMGRAAAEAAAEHLAELCRATDLVVVVTGLGKGTGSGAAPVVARVAREQGALVLALATLPFEFEGQRRAQQAQAALGHLKRECDAVVCLPNQKLTRLMDENTTLDETLRLTNQMLAEGVRGLWRLATRDGLIRADFADLCHVVRGRQAESCFAIAEAAGEHRAREVVEQLLASPLLDGGRALAEADAVLVSLAGGTDLKHREVAAVMEQLNRAAENAEMIVGACTEPAFAGRLAITLIAAKRNALELVPGGDGERAEAEAPPPACEFPTRRGEEGAERPPEPKPPSRYVGQVELSPQLREELIQKHAAANRSRRKRGASTQQLLPLDVVPKGRFAKSEPTVHRGEDLDTPTYIRRGIALN